MENVLEKSLRYTEKLGLKKLYSNQPQESIFFTKETKFYWKWDKWVPCFKQLFF